MIAVSVVFTPVASGVSLAQSSDVVSGVIVDTTDPVSMRLAREAGFTHAKMILYWPRLEPICRTLPLERHRPE